MTFSPLTGRKALARVPFLKAAESTAELSDDCTMPPAKCLTQIERSNRAARVAASRPNASRLRHAVRDGVSDTYSANPSVSHVPPG